MNLRHLITILILVVCPAAVGQEALYVDELAPPGGDGSSWALAFDTLEEALAAAAPDLVTIVRVAGGTYIPGGVRNVDRTRTFAVDRPVQLLGGYAGLSGPDPDQRDPARFETMLSGELGSTAAGDNCRHVVTVTGTSAAALLDGLTITRGSTSEPPAGAPGGAGLLINSDIRVRDCIIYDNENWAYDGGGGAAVYAGHARFTACRFENNWTLTGAAALHNRARVSLIDCEIHDNGEANAAILSDDDTDEDVQLTIVRCSFSSNLLWSVLTRTGLLLMRGCTLTDKGVACFGGHATIADCAFTEVAAFGTNQGGLALRLHAPAIVSGCSFEGNSSLSDAGAIYKASRDDVWVTNCSFVGNTADDRGGAIYLVEGPMLVSNCRFRYNVAAVGGALTSLGDLTMTNCTLIDNPWNGIRLLDGTGVLRNCILWSQAFAVENVHIAAYNASLDIDYCVIQGMTGALGGQHNTAENPMLAHPSLAILPGSPCIDAGLNAPVPPCITDLAGSSRIAAQLQGSPAVVDMGAFELHGEPEPDCNTNGFADDCEASLGMGTDCDGDGLPDDCALEMGRAADCDGDGEADACLEDCDSNGLPDICEIIAGVLVECPKDPCAPDAPPGPDCNGNTASDACDIAIGISEDVNADGVPDECAAIQNLTGGTWHATIQLAVAAAQSGDEIVVAPGTWFGPIDFDDKGIRLRSAGGPDVTIIDGGGASGPVIRCDPTEGPQGTIEGFTITGGSGSDGAGLRLWLASPSVRNCVFAGNAGGGIWSQASDATIEGCVFTGNTYRGGMHISGGTLQVVDCSFLHNEGSHGGGLHYDSGSGDFTVTGCAFYDNVASHGGGMYISGRDGRVIECVFEGNSATISGGGLDVGTNFGILTVERCRIQQNMAATRGGGISAWRTRISNCLIANNLAGEQGGGVHLSSSSIINCTITRNSAARGSGIWIPSGSLVLGCIVQGNPGFDFEVDDALDPTYVPVVLSDIGGGFEGYGNIDADPRFVAPDEGDFRLRESSLAIDMVGAFDMGQGPLDLAGEPRLRSCRLDMGAYESSAAGRDCDSNGFSDGCDLLGTAIDCDGNGLLDTCSIEHDVLTDCNQDGALDICGDGTLFRSMLPLVGPLESGSTVVIPVPGGPPPTGPAELILIYRTRAHFGAWLNGFQLGTVNNTKGQSGPSYVLVRELSQQLVSSLMGAGGGSIELMSISSEWPSEGTFCTGILAYPVEGAQQDCNANGVRDSCEILLGHAVDANGNGTPDECDPDCNGNGLPDFMDLEAATSRDCNANGVPDECDIAAGFSIDDDGDGMPDECLADCNGNGRADWLDLLDGASGDCNGTGVPDECEQDCNGNGIHDECELAAGTAGDCDGDGVLDECAIGGGAADDCNGNGVPDGCDLSPPFSVTSDQLTPLSAGNPQYLALSSLPIAAGPVTLTVHAVADLDGNSGYVDLKLNHTVLGRLFQATGTHCPEEADSAVIELPADEFNAARVEGTNLFELRTGNSVGGGCDGWARLRLNYSLAGTSADRDRDGIPDECGCTGDVTVDGAVDVDDLVAVIVAWGTNDPDADVNDDGIVNVDDLVMVIVAWGACSLG